jgi:hypothetical protein
MTRQIVVRPALHGWAVHIEGDAVALAFTTGARAEAAAREIAGRFADAGEPVELRVYLRDGALAGRFLCPSPGGVRALAHAS